MVAERTLPVAVGRLADAEHSLQVAVVHSPAVADMLEVADGSWAVQRAMDSARRPAAVLGSGAASTAAEGFRTADCCGWMDMEVNWALADCSPDTAHFVADCCRRSSRSVGCSPADPDYSAALAADCTPVSVLAQRTQAVEREPKAFWPALRSARLQSMRSWRGWRD